MTEDSITKIAFISLGWLLGMLSPIIVNAITRRRENILGRAAIFAELKEFACILSIATYGARRSLGTVDRKFLEWLKTVLEQQALTPSAQKLLPSLRTQLTWSDEQIKTAFQLIADQNGKGTILQRYSVPLLDARVSAMWTFETTFQRKLLEIRRNIALLDDVVDRSRKYFDMTFSKLDETNHNLVTENFIQACELYAERAEIIIDQIRNLD